jgi:lipopolysaccharide/colanic/teichoic acid biosynthesis glycosyltransferase
MNETTNQKTLPKGVLTWEGGLEEWPDLFRELCNPATGEVDPDWYQLRLKYRRPFAYWFSMHSAPGRVLKRIMDVIGSAVAICLLSPVFIATAIAIRLESKGPIFFFQRRVGRGGREFAFIKFRSMVPNAEALKAQLMTQNESGQGVIFKMKDDPRITKVGRFIRKYSIDELPQFFNVFRGDMSLIGPRPPVPGEVVQYETDAWKRLTVVPGLSCIWQVSGRSNIGFRDQVQLDIRYILDQDLWLDFVLMFRTVPAVLKGEGAF